MAARVRALRLEDLDALPDPCRGCVFWQTTRGALGGTAHDPAAQDAWWQAVQLEWGVPGRAVWRDDQLIAYVMFAPAPHVQRRRALDPAVSPDAIVLMTMWVHPSHRRGGLARHLLQVVVREAVTTGHDAVEAHGLLAASSSLSPTSCVVSGAFLERVGFQKKAAATATALYRLETARAVRWTDSVGHALGDVVAALSRRERAPARPVLESRTTGTRPDH